MRRIEQVLCNCISCLQSAQHVTFIDNSRHKHYPFVSIYNFNKNTIFCTNILKKKHLLNSKNLSKGLIQPCTTKKLVTLTKKVGLPPFQNVNPFAKPLCGRMRTRHWSPNARDKVSDYQLEAVQ